MMGQAFGAQIGMMKMSKQYRSSIWPIVPEMYFGQKWGSCSNHGKNFGVRRKRRYT